MRFVKILFQMFKYGIGIRALLHIHNEDLNPMCDTDVSEDTEKGFFYSLLFLSIMDSGCSVLLPWKPLGFCRDLCSIKWQREKTN